ncbi:MAG: hypothetical protein IT249_20440 [Chitinophagaceae bacterium]|nr:hypothetical protein [Chitinophagaceae bacterium]
MTKYFFRIMICLTAIIPCTKGHAQTDADAIMTNKNQLCNGFLYNYSSWDHYWEGGLKRNNLNLGTVSTQSVMYMANYGITNNLNLIAGLPYVWTKASDGTLAGMKGIQDISAFLKWRFFNHKTGNNSIAVYTVGGFSTPLSNYTPDYQPLSIGLGSTNLTAKAMLDYRYKNFTITGSAAYTWRSNLTIDRDAYYEDNQIHFTDKAEMPDVTNLQLRAGYRSKYLVAEGILNQMTTHGGGDITRNNMPFPSNRMNATSAGVFVKYTIPAFTHLELVGMANYTLDGRNAGQSTSYGGGIFYIFYLSKKSNPAYK